ncbi:hypothetical protein [Haliangium sp.]|uniref:hypothetical protein n=1 Tax=Haliangium sp. TaxID=2663208 RepID=UPI003D12896E
MAPLLCALAWAAVAGPGCSAERPTASEPTTASAPSEATQRHADDSKKADDNKDVTDDGTETAGPKTKEGTETAAPTAGDEPEPAEQPGNDVAGADGDRLEDLGTSTRRRPRRNGAGYGGAHDRPESVSSHDDPAPEAPPPVPDGTTAAAPDPAPSPSPVAEQPDANAGPVESFLAGLSEEAIAFHVPDKAIQDQLFSVHLLVHPGRSETELAVTLSQALDAGRPADVHTRRTKLGEEMRARLTSPTLTITPRGDETQLVREAVETRWQWDVIATTGGSHKLTLSLYAIPQGRSSGVEVKTFEETLEVEVPLTARISDTVSNNWEWMWTFILGPVVALLWRRRHRHHHPPPQS